MGSFKSHSFKKNILQVVAAIVNTLLQADSDISHYSLNSVTCVTGAVPTQGRSIRGPFIVIGLQCGAQYRESGSLVLTFLMKTIARLP